MLLKEFRQKYPQYDDVPDKELADALYRKFYSDKPIDEYYKQIGLSIGMPTEFAQPEPITGMESAFAPAPVGSKPKPKSVMEGYKGEPTPLIEAMGAPISRQEYDRILRSYNAATPEQREVLLSRNDYIGNVAQAIDAEYKRFSKASPITRTLDLRREARVEQLVRQGANYEVADLITQQEMERGELPSPLAVAQETPPETTKAIETRKLLATEGLFARAGVRGATGIKQGFAGAAEAITDLTGDTEASKYYERIGRQSDTFLKQLGDPKGSTLAAGFESVVNSIVQQAPGLVLGVLGGSAPALMYMGSLVFGQEYSAGKKANLSPSERTIRAGLMAAAEVVFERYGLGETLAGIRAAAQGVPTSQLAEYFGKAIAKEVPAEMATTTAQFGVEKTPIIGLDQEATATDFVKQLADTVIQTILQTGTLGGASYVASQTPKAISGLFRGEPDVTVPYNRRPSPTLSGESIPISGRREPTFTPEGAGRVEQPTVGEPPSAPVVPRGRKETQPNSLEIDRASLYPIIDELEQYDPELAKYAREVVNDRSQRITQDDVDILTAQLNNAKAKGTPSAPTPSEAIETEKKGPAAPAKGAEVATAAKPDPNAPFNEFEQQEYDLAQKLLQTPGGKSFGEGVLSRLQGPMRFTKPSTQQSVDFIAEKLKQYETPSQAESPSVTNTLRDTLRDNTQRERLILQQYETEMQREDAPANQILSQTNGVLARINDAIRQAGFMPYDGASIRTSAPSNIQALYKLASMISAGGYSILSQRLAQDKKYQAFSADKLKILFDKQNKDLAAANEALDKLAAPKEVAERTSEQILNEQKEVLAERNKLRTSRNRPPSGKSPARVKWDELTSKFDELTQELAEVSKKEKAAKTSKPRTLEQVAKERKDLTAQRDALLTSKGKVPAVRSPARRKYDRLTEEINKLYAEELRLMPKKPVEAGVKDEVDIAREKRIAFLEGELDRANREIEELNKEPSEPLSDQQLYAKRQQIELLEERKAKLQDSLDKARAPRIDIGGDFFDITELFVGPPPGGGYTSKRRAKAYVDPMGFIYNAKGEYIGSELWSSKNPSLRRAVAKYFKQYEAGKITAEEYAREVNRVYEESKPDKEPADLVRGQFNFRERLLRAERVGELPRGTLAFTEWFISLNPSLLNDVAISLKTPKPTEDGIAGLYLPLPRIVRLLVGNLKRETVVHELLHHFERLMPEKLQSEIRELWLNSVIDKLNRSPYGSPARKYLILVHNSVLGRGQGALGISDALEMVLKGQVPPSYYQYINPSEFWAVNATEIMLRRFGGTTSVINRIKQWLKELIIKIKDYFGLPSDVALIRALDSLAKADGEYKSKNLLAKNLSGYYSFAGPKSIEYDPYDPQEIADDNARKEGNLKQAKDLEINGASPIEIWNKTGWWHDTIDGQWRYEINDSKAVFKADLWANPPDQRTTVGEILDHPELYKAYPELKNVVVFKRPAFLDFFQSMQGWLSKDGTITVTPYAKDPFATLLHETQHWIQRKEGFGPGGSVEGMQIANNVDILELLKKRYEYLLDKARGVQGATQEDSWRIIAPEQTSEAKLLRKIATVQDAIDAQFELGKAAAKRDSLGQKKTNLQNELNVIPEASKTIQQELKNAVTTALEAVKKEIAVIKTSIDAKKQKIRDEIQDLRGKQLKRIEDRDVKINKLLEIISTLDQEISDLNIKTLLTPYGTPEKKLIGDLVSAKRVDRTILYDKIGDERDLTTAKIKRLQGSIDFLEDKIKLTLTPPELAELEQEETNLRSTSTYTGKFYKDAPKDPNVIAAADELKKLTERETELKKDLKQVEDDLEIAKKKYTDLEGALGTGAGRESITTIKYDLYQMISGEIESRNTEKRLKMTEEERAQTPPSATADIDAAFAFFNTLAEEAAQAAPPGGPKKITPRPRGGPISGASKWRTVEDATRRVSDILNDKLKGRMTWAEVREELMPALWNPAFSKLRRAWLYTATLRQMADVTRYKFPQLSTAINIVDRMTSYRLKKLNEAQAISLDWLKAQNNKPKQSVLLGKIMLDATIVGKDPDQGATNPKLDAAWASLDPEFKDIYRRVRDYFKKQLDEMVLEMKRRVMRLPKLSERKAALRKINEQFGPDKIVFPYFPLRRFGEYWFQVDKGTFKEFYEFESEITRNLSRNKRIRELEAGNKKQKELAEKVDFGAGISELLSKNLASTQILQDVQKLVDSIVPPPRPAPPAGTGVTLAAKTAEEVRKELQDSLNQLIYIMLPQQSIRKMFINRKNVQGASGDMLRVFTDVAVHSAYQAARFKYSEDFINNINRARDYINEFFKKSPETKAVYRDYINELEKRTKTILSAEDKSLLAKAAGTSGTIVFFTMLSSPFTALLNTLGFAVFTGSKLGGKYGYTEASEVMLKNMGRYWLTAPSRTLKPVANAMTQFKPSMVLDMQFPSIVEGGQLSPLMQRAADRFIEEGQINVSLTNDIFDLSDRPSELYTTRYEIIKKILGGLFHQSERANREVALLSAFELEYNKLLNEPKRSTSGFIMRDANGDPLTYTPDEAFEEAIEEAKNIAGLTLGDFSRQMKSRLFANVPLSVILKFKQYAVMATYNYIRAAQMFAVPYTNKEIELIRKLFEEQKLSQPEIDRRIEEIVAFKKDIGKQSGKELAGILGVTFLFGGLEAMPFFWIVMPIMAGMLTFGDDDDDDLFDYVNWFRNWASSWLGGMSFARGPVSELLGGSISERVSLDPVSMFYRDGRYSPDLVEGLIQDIIANAGPVVGLGVNIAEAVKLFNEGQYSRSMEKVMPALFAKPLQAYRYGTEGATTRSGEVQMAPEDFSGWMLAMQAIGLQPEKLALRQKSAIQGKEYNAKVLDKEKALLDRLWLERDSSKGFDAAIDNAVEFYERHPTLISEDGSFADKIIKSFETRAEQIAEAEAIGARIDKRLREEIMPMLEYGMPKPVIPKMTLQEVRQKYPQYNNLSDKELSDALKAKGILK